jgi:cellulose synthase/poly-beta-1,6-N-acetylglucosamine synthase-like glycosyltransferase
MSILLWTLIALPVTLALYAYVAYPLLVWLLARRHPGGPPAEPAEWPTVSITVPAYNEEVQIRGTIESLLLLDYPADRRQILVVSDASTDRTDEIVREYADRGVELLRMPVRGGKGAAEGAAARRLTGEIIVNTDASVRIRPDALKALIRWFGDPTVGLASGRDISVARVDTDVNVGESGYVGYEMWIRRLESRFSGIIGASGCFYAIRAHLHRVPLPSSLSRDFASAMITREHGYRAVSVDEATCLVPRTGSLRREYRRKVRTMTRGMETLSHKRHLLNPFRYGPFGWMLFSHKVCRWLIPWAALPAVAAVALASTTVGWALWATVGLAAFGVLALLGWLGAERPSLPRVLSLPAFIVAGNLAAVHAGWRAMQGDDDSLWEPTRRATVPVHAAAQPAEELEPSLTTSH